MEAQKIILKLDVFDYKAKEKAIRSVCGHPGVISFSMDMKDKKLTVNGETDPISIVGKLRKICLTEIVSVGPAKEPEKKKEEPPMKEPGKDTKDPLADFFKAYPSYPL